MMFCVYLIFIMAFLLGLILFGLNLFLSKKKKFDREKKSMYECGFDSFNLARLSFSVHFFMIGLIFLIFDIELSFLFPLVYFFNLSVELSLFSLIFYLFFIILFILGLLFEWLDDSMSWMK